MNLFKGQGQFKLGGKVKYQALRTRDLPEQQELKDRFFIKSPQEDQKELSPFIFSC